MGLLDNIRRNNLSDRTSRGAGLLQQQPMSNFLMSRHMEMPQGPPMPREDGGVKGPGWLGALRRKDGGYSGELTIGVDWGQGETYIPLLVPGLTDDEVRYLLDGNDNPKTIPESIMRKAVEHAQNRIRQGLSPYAQPK